MSFSFPGISTGGGGINGSSKASNSTGVKFGGFGGSSLSFGSVPRENNATNNNKNAIEIIVIIVIIALLIKKGAV